MRLSMIPEGKLVSCNGRIAEVVRQQESEVKVLVEGQTQYWSAGSEVQLADKPVDAVVVQQEPSQAEPTEEKMAKRHDLFGFPVTAVLRWMGKDGWSWEAALRVIRDLKCECAEATVKIQVKAGSKGERGEPAKLTEQQIDQLRSLDVQLEPKKAKPVGKPKQGVKKVKEYAERVKVSKTKAKKGSK